MLFFLVWMAFALVTAIAAAARDRNPIGWFLIGLIAGVFGLIAVLVMPPLRPPAPIANGPAGNTSLNASLAELDLTRRDAPETKVCPVCAEEVKAAAIRCRFCGHPFTEDGSAAS